MPMVMVAARKTGIFFARSRKILLLDMRNLAALWW